MNQPDSNSSGRFIIKPWHPLTEIPEQQDKGPAPATENPPVVDNNIPVPQPLPGISATAMQLLWDILCYLFSAITVRIKRLSVSVRAFEKAKHELCEKGLIMESSAGQTTYLIPKREVFQLFSMPCPYKRNVSTIHSFYVLLNCFLLKKDPRYKTVIPEYKIGDRGCTADIGILCHDGTREAAEITLSTSDVLCNALKYDFTPVVSVTFICRDYSLRRGVEATFRESGLSAALLAKLECVQCSTILNRYRKM